MRRCRLQLSFSKRVTALKWIPLTIEAYAWGKMRESQEELDAHASDFGASDWREALAKLQDHYPTLDHYFPHHYGLWRACRAMAEQNDLVTWPECAIQFIPRPQWARGAAPHLYFLPYHSAPAFDEIPAVDCMLAPIDWSAPAAERMRMLKASNNSVIKLNHVVHHAGLGHHVQNWYAYNRAESRIGQIAAVDVASRLALFCAGTMAEGWATYSVKLMDEVGFLTIARELLPPPRPRSEHAPGPSSTWASTRGS